MVTVTIIRLFNISFDIKDSPIGALVKVRKLGSILYCISADSSQYTISILPISSLIAPHLFCTFRQYILHIQTVHYLSWWCAVSAPYLLSVYCTDRLHTATSAYVQLIHHFSYTCSISTPLSYPSPGSIPPFVFMSNKYTFSISFPTPSQYIFVSAHIQYPTPPAHVLYLYYPVNLVHHFSCLCQGPN